MNQPYGGWMQVSGAPLHALAQMGQLALLCATVVRPSPEVKIGA